MKQVLTLAVSVSLALAASTGVHAEEKTRFESSGFLQSLDLFITKQLDKFRDNSKSGKNDGDKDLKLSLRDASQSMDGGFLYLKDKKPYVPVETVPLSDRPDFSSLLTPAGALRDTRDLFGARSKLGITLGGKKTDPYDGLQIGLESGYRLSQRIFGETDVTNALNDTEMNVGVSVGYAGFNVDASMIRTNSVLSGDSHGYDIGLSYARKKWAARLSLSEYKQGADLLGLENEARNVISVELGASYRLSDRLGLQGGVRVYDYGQRLLINPSAGEYSQMVFLGGSLRF